MRLVLGLGGNLGDLPANFARAAIFLTSELRVLARSGIWRSAPLGPAQPDYFNAALLVESDAHPLAVLALAQRCEANAGRDRAHEERWGPRPLDIDLLVAPGLVVESPLLTLPHPRLSERRFALAPAAELAPEWLHPRHWRTLAELAAAPEVLGQRCERSGPFPPVPEAVKTTAEC